MKFCPQCDTGYPDDATACPIHAVLLIEMRDLRPGIVIANTYRIFRKLGQGATGSVYLAENAQTEEPRALRFLTVELSRDVAFMSRYQRTARTLSQIQQKNIINSGVLETAEDGSLFFAMDFVDGPSLRELMNMAPGPFDVDMSLAIARCIGEGLGAAHAAGIVHRDIKPENILIAREGAVLAPKIANFGMGVIKQNGSALRPPGRTVLTSIYTAPEQWLDAKSAELDGRADLYALGAILFEMLTGEALFHANDFEEWVLRRLVPVPRRPSDLRPDLASRNGLDQLVLSLLATKPQDRPKDAAEVLRRLDAVQFGIPVLETPPVSVLDSPSPVLETAPIGVPETPSAVLDTAPVSVPDVVEEETQPTVSLEGDSNEVAELLDLPIPMDAGEDAEEDSAEVVKQESYFGDNDKEEEIEEVSAEVLKQESYFGSRDQEEETEAISGNGAEAPSFSGDDDTAEDTEEKSAEAEELPSFSSRILARGDAPPLPKEIPDVSSFFGGKETQEDAGEKTADAVDPSTFFSRLAARSDTQAQPTEIAEQHSFLDSKGTGKDTEENPSVAAEFQNFTRRDPLGGNAQALPREAPEQPKFSGSLERGNDVLFRPKGTDDLESIFRREYMGVEEEHASAVEPPSFTGRADTDKGAEDPPKNLTDLPDWLRRVQSDKVSGNESKRTAEPATNFGGVDKSPKWEPGSVAESPSVNGLPYASKGTKAVDWVATGVPSDFGRVNTGNDIADIPRHAAESPNLFSRVDLAGDSADIPTLDAEQPSLFAPADAPWDAEKEHGQTVEVLELLSSALPDRAIYVHEEEPEEVEKPRSKAARVILMVIAAMVTLAALGFAIWRSGSSNPIQPTAKLAQACDAGDAKACSDLAVWYERTNTVSDGDSRAATLYSKACDGALAQACRKLGLKYLLGDGIARDTPRAMGLFSKACDQGDYEGCDTLADIYHAGKGVKISDRKAAALYSKACALGDEFGCKWAKKLAAATLSAKPPAKFYPASPDTIPPTSSPDATQ